MARILFFILCVVIAQFSMNCNAQDNSAIHSDKLQKIEVLLNEFMSNGDVPAISVGLISDGKIIFINKGTFKRNVKRRIDEHSIFQTASISKIFTAIIVNTLVIKGKLNLNESIVTYLPQNYPAKTIEKLKAITVRDLLHHRSGLPSESKIYKKYRKGNGAFIYNYTSEDFKRDLNKIKLKSKPGEKFYYSNFGYALLGFLAERVTNESFENLLQEFVGSKFHLSSTSTHVKNPQNLVTAYRKDKRQIVMEPWVMGKLTAPSGIYSTTSDLSNMILQQLKAYAMNENNSLRLTKDTRSISERTNMTYGYGFYVYGNTGSYGHGGEMDGYAGDYSINPKLQRGHVILTSCAGDEVYGLSTKIATVLYD
ncbi:serine hydrolase domain-containing protein [uncultured Dokdonia sp.]|uniref:serine hydrolase domain-containing protein n=1 Tax=uncultured Dokdonia sp. TaxID=575653 RepID=UPI0026039309|nr:serine hydrolase domain-containing protein [uncultured Dokdonia sp.]